MQGMHFVGNCRGIQGGIWQLLVLSFSPCMAMVRIPAYLKSRPFTLSSSATRKLWNTNEVAPPAAIMNLGEGFLNLFLYFRVSYHVIRFLNKNIMSILKRTGLGCLLLLTLFQNREIGNLTILRLAWSPVIVVVSQFCKSRERQLVFANRKV